ncbi:MAG: ATP-binding protein, partial [Chloroflexota bacterium]
RPESLEAEGIVAALNKQIAATSARYELAITAELSEEPDIPLDGKEMLYRIGQEALHNIVKHAQATSVRVCLQHVNGRLELTVADDGVGFDPAGEFPGHLGLRSMRERAAKAGGDLTIESEPGAGSTVTVTIVASS